MSLVTDPTRKVQPVSLIRESSPLPNSCAALIDANKLLARGLEAHFGGLTGLPTNVSQAPTSPPQSHEQIAVGRAFGWDPEIHPVQFGIGRVAIAQLVDCFYGGLGVPVAQDKKLSTSEERFLDRMAEAIAPLFGAAWRAAVSIEPEVVAASEEKPGSTKIEFSVACGEWAPFSVSFSYAPSTLASLTASSTTEGMNADEAALWEQTLTALVLTVPFPVRTILAEPTVPISQLSRLAVGDVLPVRLLPQMDLTVAGIRIAKGTVGDHDGRAAFRLD